MRYLVLMRIDESVSFTEEEDRAALAAIDRWIEEMRSRNVLVDGNRLVPATDAATVRVREGETLRTDGPFAEAKEQVAGFNIIDCADLDEALEIAAKHPIASYGAIEVRQFVDC